MIKLRMLLESSERRYILPPNGRIFEVRDHVGWAVRNVLQQKYGKYGWEDLGDLIEEVYQDLDKLGYLMLIWLSGTDELYVRGDDKIRSLTASQYRKIEELAYKIADGGLSYKVTLIDDNGHEKLIWQHPSTMNEGRYRKYFKYLNEVTNNISTDYIGVVTLNGEVRGWSTDNALTDNHLNHGVAGEWNKWRYVSKDIKQAPFNTKFLAGSLIWTITPQREEANAAENFINKRGGEVTGNFDLHGGERISDEELF